jgi:hypothetical protein
MKDIEAIARVAHQVNKAYCESMGDLSQADWEEAPAWVRESVIAGVKFHIANPGIYELFKKFALHLIEDKSQKKISSKLIINRIRWEIYVETTGKDYRINDAFTAYYARLFVNDFPQYRNTIELRELRS